MPVLTKNGWKPHTFALFTFYRFNNWLDSPGNGHGTCSYSIRRLDPMRRRCDSHTVRMGRPEDPGLKFREPLPPWWLGQCCTFTRGTYVARYHTSSLLTYSLIVALTQSKLSQVSKNLLNIYGVFPYEQYQIMNMRTLDTLTMTRDTVMALGNWDKAEEVKGMKTVDHTSCLIPTCPPSQPKLS